MVDWLLWLLKRMKGVLEREEFQSISVRNEKEMIKKTRGWVMGFELNNMEREITKTKYYGGR